MDPRLHLQLQLLEPEPFACSCLALGRARWSWSCCGNCAAGCVLLHPHPSAPPRLRLQRARWRMQLLLQRRQQQRQRHGLFAQIPSVHAHATANAAPSPSAAWQARRLQPSASLTRKRKGRAGLQPLRRAAPPPSPAQVRGKARARGEDKGTRKGLRVLMDAREHDARCEAAGRRYAMSCLTALQKLTFLLRGPLFFGGSVGNSQGRPRWAQLEHGFSPSQRIRRWRQYKPAALHDGLRNKRESDDHCLEGRRSLPRGKSAYKAPL